MPPLLPEGTRVLSRLSTSHIAPRRKGRHKQRAVVDRRALLFSDVHSMDGSDADESMRSYVKLCNLTDWAMESDYWIGSVGDFADVAAGFTPEQIIEPRRAQIRKLNAYDKMLWITGNHDHGIINWRAYGFRGIPEKVWGRTLIKHGHSYYWANYGGWCWLVGKPIIWAGTKLGRKSKRGRTGEWLAHHTYFGNRKMRKKGKAELNKRGLRLLICGHTHKPEIHYDADKRLAVLNLGDMVEHQTFGIVTPEEILLCV